MNSQRGSPQPGVEKFYAARSVLITLYNEHVITESDLCVNFTARDLLRLERECVVVIVYTHGFKSYTPLSQTTPVVSTAKSYVLSSELVL